MNHNLLLVPVFALASGLCAQNPTSPFGFANTEGNSSFVHFSATTTSNARRYQQIDNTLLGNAWTIRSLGFRRNGTSSGGGSNEPPRTMMMEIVFGGTRLAVVSSDFDANFAPTLRSTVFTPKTVNMPDWTGLNGTPSPFDFVVPFDVPYGYPGSYPLVIDFTYSNLAYTVGGVTGGSSVDRDYKGYDSSSGSTLGIGCTAAGQTSSFLHNAWLQNNGTTSPNFGMRLRIDGLRGPATAPAVVHIDVADANTTIPGLCSTVHAMPTIGLFAGVSDATGDYANTFFSFPHTQALVGTSLVTQLVALDVTQSPFPVVLSNGEMSTMPDYNNGAGHEIAWHWSSLPVNLNNTVFWGGGLVLELGL